METTNLDVQQENMDFNEQKNLFSVIDQLGLEEKNISSIHKKNEQEPDRPKYIAIHGDKGESPYISLDNEDIAVTSISILGTDSTCITLEKNETQYKVFIRIKQET